MLFVATGYAEGTRRDFWWDVLYRHVVDPSTRAVRLFDGTILPTESDEQRRAAFERAKLTVERHGLAAVEGISLTAMPERAEVSERTVLDWNGLRTLDSEGVYIAPHTRNHPVLSWLPLAEAAEEVERSRFDIEQQLSRSWPIFAYPHGHPRHIPAGLDSILQDSGFRYAVTMIEGHNIHGRTPPLGLKRLNMAPHLSLQEFRLALTGVYDLYALAKRMAP